MKLKNIPFYFFCCVFFQLKAQVQIPSTGVYLVTDSTFVVENTDLKAIKPNKMVFVPGGYTRMGSLDGLATEQPTFGAYITPFYIDQYEVSVAEFDEFVAATGFVTQAEKFGDAAVLDYPTGEWKLVTGANWRYPLGPEQPASLPTHPVTQVSLYDARAYAAWAKKELPTEFEWEHAAKNGTNTKDWFSFGNEVVANGRWLANIWQGNFPTQNSIEDGFLYTAPVGSFENSPLNIFDLSGNVWEWTDSPRSVYPEVINSADTTEFVQRGGSFLCIENICFGYRVSARAFCTPETSLFHVGFRCIKRIEM